MKEKAIHDAIIERYGKDKLRDVRLVTKAHFGKAIKCVLKRDYPHLAASFKWGGFKTMLNHLNNALDSN